MLNKKSHYLMRASWKWRIIFYNVARLMSFQCPQVLSLSPLLGHLSVLNLVLSDCHKSRRVTWGDFRFSPLMLQTLSPASAHAEMESSLRCFICQSEMVEGTTRSILPLWRETAVSLSLREGGIGDDCWDYISLCKMRALWKGSEGGL